MPSATREAQGDRSLLDICLSVHGDTTGSCEVGDEERYRLIGILQDALRHWESSPPFSEGFDSAVLDLIVATLLEADAKVKREYFTQQNREEN